jgi:ATP-binding cassette, subfamily B, bacterial CvaB/MchF/RaxB
MLIAFIAYSDQFVRRLGRVVDAPIEMKILSVHLDRVGDITLTSSETRLTIARTLATFELLTLSGDLSRVLQKPLG